MHYDSNVPLLRSSISAPLLSPMPDYLRFQKVRATAAATLLPLPSLDSQCAVTATFHHRSISLIWRLAVAVRSLFVSPESSRQCHCNVNFRRLVDGMIKHTRARALSRSTSINISSASVQSPRQYNCRCCAYRLFT